jgi:hypothetical protein
MVAARQLTTASLTVLIPVAVGMMIVVVAVVRMYLIMRAQMVNLLLAIRIPTHTKLTAFAPGIYLGRALSLPMPRSIKLLSDVNPASIHTACFIIFSSFIPHKCHLTMTHDILSSIIFILHCQSGWNWHCHVFFHNAFVFFIPHELGVGINTNRLMRVFATFNCCKKFVITIFFYISCCT